MTKQAVIYTRFSPRPNAKECDSCEKQKKRCEAYCKQKGYEVISVLADENTSGGDLDRPGIAKAIDTLANWTTGGALLVVDSSDRLARDMLVNLTIRQQVADAGATIEYANGSPNGTSPEAVLFQNMLAAFSAYERDRIRLRTKQGLQKKRENGERTTGKIPIGWKLDPNDPKRLIVCEEEREAIMRACRLHWNDFSSRQIAEQLDFEFEFRGKHWSPRTIRRLIQKHAYWACPISGKSELEPDHP